MNDFTGFRFNNIHSKDLHLVVVTSSDRYEKNLLPEVKDYTQDVPGGNGKYYFGSTFSKREFSVNVAFDQVDEKTWRKISNLFATDKLCDLIFDELPYKTYKAKISKKPEFKFICFTDRDTGERVYKGEGTLNFICYFPFAFGFNKYIIRAADNYLLEKPKSLPINDNRYENPYRKEEREVYNKDTKEFYNVKNNMDNPWKGGYPTIEQVQAGELYFKDENGRNELIDVRDYFKNVPEWAASSKLLVTPTLDYDQDLIFLPQYSKTNYINMDIGLNQENALIGSRLLVYNPGDMPVDFELKMNNIERTFDTPRGSHFQIRRFNVQRLPISAAVDWTGLKTVEEAENIPYKYGNKYFKIATSLENDDDKINGIDGMTTISYKELNGQHPSHTFIAEPIPREKLGHYIRLFYWQSSLILDEKGEPTLNFEEGIRLAERYEELYELCIDDYERYELYWKTLKEVILEKYSNASPMKKVTSYFYVPIYENNSLYICQMKNGEISVQKDVTNFESLYLLNRDTGKNLCYSLELNDFIYDKRSVYPDYFDDEFLLQDIVTKKIYRFNPIKKKISNSEIESIDLIEEKNPDIIENFIYNYIHMPPEFIRKNSELFYNQEEFNINMIPNWYTQDYFDIKTENIEDTTLFLDSEKRMLYNIINPEYKKNHTDTYKNWYNYKPSKTILNDNIEKGHWFKLPPGWSLIEVTPICDEDNWGGKRWLDGRPFDWGYGGKYGQKQSTQKLFDIVYKAATEKFMKDTGLVSINLRTDDTYKKYGIDSTGKYKDKFAYEFYKNKEVQNEYKLLKTIHELWRLQKGKHIVDNEQVEIKGTIDEWWWYACNYIWANFPPLYWGYADILNNAEIKYTPLFY